MNTQLLSTIAAQAFNSKNYALAHKYYLELANLLGNRNFYANIKLCEKRMGVASLNLGWERIDESQSWYIELNPSLVGPALWEHLRRSALLRTNEEQSVRYFDKFSLRVGIITDEFMYNYYRGAIDQLVPITPANYQSALSSGIDLLMFVTCWFGLKNEWRGVAFDNNLHKTLDEIVGLCKKSGIPTIFQSIEDPSNYRKFLHIAKKFDYIFTTDVDVIENYKKDCAHDRVYFGEYGFNPLFNNPRGSSQPRINAAFFAGSYPQRYEERCRDMELIFDGIVRAGAKLVIADRNYGTTDKSLRYPDKYNNYIIDKFDHRELQEVHKLFRYNINLNSIQGSPTMCAMRVYELQAQGEILLSNYAKSVEQNFPLVKILRPNENLAILFKKSFSNFIAEKYLRAKAVRQMYADKTVFDQARKMFSIVGVLAGQPKKNPPKTYVLYEKLTDKIRRCFEAQSLENKELLDMRSFVQGRIDYAPNDYFTLFSEEYNYTRDYLVDQLNCFKFTNATYATKLSVMRSNKYLLDVENEFTNRIHDFGLTVFSCSAADVISQKLQDGDIGPLLLEGGYANNPFEADYFSGSVEEVD